jgi:hypothetical protein
MINGDRMVRAAIRKLPRIKPFLLETWNKSWQQPGGCLQR